jgi:ligand-binding sensor domain-containing protein
MFWARAHVVLAFLFAICYFKTSSALNPNIAITQYVQSVYRAPQSLPHDDVSTILQTHDGYLWIGTVEGLARFDGIRSVVFNKANTPAFANNWIMSLLEDHTGRLWIGTLGGGLVSMKDGLFKHYGERQGIAADIVSSLFEDSTHRVWIGTHGKGLFYFENGKIFHESGLGPLIENVNCILEDRNHILWIGTESGLYRHDKNGLKLLTRIDGLTDNEILSLAADRKGLWIGTTTGGLNRIVEGKITAITKKEGLTMSASGRLQWIEMTIYGSGLMAADWID